MKYLLYIFSCGNCEQEYKAPAMTPHSYGEFLLRSPSGDIAYMNAMEDDTYSEVSALLNKLPSLRDMGEARTARVLQSIFGVACDLDSQGKQFSMIAKPNCPYCDHKRASSWRPTKPAEFVEESFPHITHYNWKQLKESEKLRLLSSAVDAL